MLLPIDLMASLNNASLTQSSKGSQGLLRPDSPGLGGAVAPVSATAATMAVPDDATGDAWYDAETDPRVLINNLLSQMTDEQAAGFSADLVARLQEQLAAQTLASPALLSAAAAPGSADPQLPLAVPVQSAASPESLLWSVDELLQWSAQDSTGGSVLPPLQQNLPLHNADAVTAAATPTQAANAEQILAHVLALLNRTAVEPRADLPGGLPGALPDADAMDLARLTSSGALADGSVIAGNAMFAARLQVGVTPAPASAMVSESTTAPATWLQTSGLTAERVAQSTDTSLQAAAVMADVMADVTLSGLTDVVDGAAVVDRGVVDDSAAVTLSDRQVMPAADERVNRQPLSTLTDSPDGRPLTAAEPLSTRVPAPQPLTLAPAPGAALETTPDNGRMTGRAEGGAQLTSATAQASELAEELFGATRPEQSQSRQAALMVQQPALQGRTDSLLSQPGLAGQQVWGEHLGRQLLLMSANGVNSAQIRLDPPELGTLTIKIELVDRAATVHFVSQHAMVRDALEAQLPRLQEMFRNEGMNLLESSVSDQSANNTGGQNGEGQSRRGNRGQAGDNPEGAGDQVVVRRSEHLVDQYV